MRIEKISEKQIRCTLSHDDLSTRHINAAELAYGSEKARSLFREMLTKASREFGFQAENTPLMIEAVPLAGDSIMLLITKVEDPEELDTRFARFAPTDSGETSIHNDQEHESLEDCLRGADDVLEEFSRLCEDALSMIDDDQEDIDEPDFYQIYRFESLDSVCNAARILCGVYDEENTLYKDPDTHSYLLVLHKGAHSPETFNKVCNILSEYGEHFRGNAGTEAHFMEHFDIIVDGFAIQALENL